VIKVTAERRREMKVSVRHLLGAWIGLMLVPTQTTASDGAQVKVQEDKASKVVCRREAETGSLVKKRRVCRTVREWDEADRITRAAMTEGQMSGGSRGQ
jgi:hypothetical protein